MATQQRERWLFIRMDRMGDVVLTLPVDALVHQRVDVTWALKAETIFIAEQSDPARTAITLPSRAKNILSWYHWLKLQSFSGALVFQAPLWIYVLLFVARVPKRWGRAHRIWSTLFLNRWIHQKRSQSDAHETDLNSDLVRRFFSFASQKIDQPSYLKLKSAQLKKDAQRIVVHPGMGGSARNWSQEKYIETIHQLLDANRTVYVTGTLMDQPYLEKIFQAQQSWIQQHSDQASRWVWSVGLLNSHQLLELLNTSQAVLAPSTGVLHLAAALGVKTVGLYSPVHVQRPSRWAARGSNVQIHVPDVQCPGHYRCLMDKCSLYDCMAQIEVNEIVRNLKGIEGQ